MRSFGGAGRCLPATAALIGALAPQPAFAAADVGTISLSIVLGAVALAVAACLWAISAGAAAARFRREARSLTARADRAISARDALIEGGRESVLVWGDGADPAYSYGGGEALLEACLNGPDALILSQALGDLSENGAHFTVTMQTSSGEPIRARGGPVGGFAALWLEKEPARAPPDAHALLDMLPIPVWLRGPTLSLAWVNRAYANATGMENAVAAVAAQTALDRSERDVAANALAHGHAVESRRYAVVGGQRRALAISEIPLGDGGVLGAAIDVTGLSDAEAKLQQYLDAHADTLDRLATAVAIFGRDRRLSFYNRAFAQLWELPEDWLNTHPADSEILDRLRELRRLPEQRDYRGWKQERLAAYERPGALLPEELWHLPGGKTLRAVAQPHPFGGLTYLYEDVSEKLALESSYNTLIGVQRATLDALNEGVAVFGPDGRLKLHNAAFARLWRLDAAELSGQPHVQAIARACVSRSGKETIWRTLVDAISSGCEKACDWGQIEGSDGAIVAVSLAPLPDGAALATFADVTDRARIESALRERNEALEAGDKLKSDFVHHASFLFRDPLNAVHGFAELLASGRAGPLNPKQGDYVQDILTASHRLAEITGDILDLAMIDSGNMRLELEPVDIRELLTRVAEPLRRHADSLAIDFTVDAPAGPGTAILDRRRIRQVVFNLLSNAFKYTPHGGQVALRATIDADDVQITVSDSGPGIAPELKANVFDRFAAQGRAGQRAGAGLGLALVNRFIELHDGWVEIDTGHEGGGTLVRCHLPRRPRERPGGRKEAA